MTEPEILTIFLLLHKFSVGVDALDFVVQVLLVYNEESSRAQQRIPAVFLEEGSH